VEAEPSRVFNILPPLGGRVTQLNVRLGDHVTAGQPLAVIDSGDLAQAYSDAEKARAQLALTKRALERARGLSQVGGGAVKDVESASNDEAQAEAEFNRADARLKAIAGSATLTGTRTLTISAPAAGVVTALSTAQGAYINDPTQTMLTITNLERVWVTANVPEADVGFVAKGQAADVSFVAYPGQVFHGTVMFVSAVMEPDTRRTKVRIGFDNPDDRLKPNMFATVTFKAPAREVLSVPDSALLMNNDSTTVFVETAPWTFVRRAIEPGYAADGHTVVDAGLKPGERIVISGGVLLND
jgi:cobalt-zinc-cadmium efflux system membrane fusion protein